MRAPVGMRRRREIADAEFERFALGRDALRGPCGDIRLSEAT